MGASQSTLELWELSQCFLMEDKKSSKTRFIQCKRLMALGRLPVYEVHAIYRGVAHDELSAKRAGQNCTLYSRHDRSTALLLSLYSCYGLTL